MKIQDVCTEEQILAAIAAGTVCQFDNCACRGLIHAAVEEPAPADVCKGTR